jgi:hypothetical protein
MAIILAILAGKMGDQLSNGKRIVIGNNFLSKLDN